jgi:uncharacterized protein involved in exopolysaccharide biosynthesis
MNTAESGLAAGGLHEDDFDVRLFLRAVTANWVLVMALIVAGALIGFASSLLFRNVYRADAILIEADDFGAAQQDAGSGGLGELASLVGISAPRNQQTQEALATLQSRALIEEYIQEGNLLPILFASEWDAKQHAWHLHFWQRKPTLYSGYLKVKNKLLNVSEDKKTGLISVSLEWVDPRLAQRWLADLIVRTNTRLRNSAIARSNRNLAYLNGQAEKTTVVELRAAIYRLIEVEIRKAMIAEGNEDYAFRYVDPPVLPERAVFPKRLAFLLLGAFAGAVAGFAWSYVRGAVNKKGQR